jgi:hypothetical protein
MTPAALATASSCPCCTASVHPNSAGCELAATQWRVYVRTYGDWYSCFMRRRGERTANLAFFARAAHPADSCRADRAPKMSFNYSPLLRPRALHLSARRLA